MLRRKQFELFTYFVIDLWIIRALSADLAAYSVVHSSSTFSLVLLITKKNRLMFPCSLRYLCSLVQKPLGDPH